MGINKKIKIIYNKKQDGGLINGYDILLTFLDKRHLQELNELESYITNKKNKLDNENKHNHDLTLVKKQINVDYKEKETQIEKKYDDIIQRIYELRDSNSFNELTQTGKKIDIILILSKLRYLLDITDNGILFHFVKTLLPKPTYQKKKQEQEPNPTDIKKLKKDLLESIEGIQVKKGGNNVRNYNLKIAYPNYQNYQNYSKNIKENTSLIAAPTRVLELSSITLQEKPNIATPTEKAKITLTEKRKIAKLLMIYYPLLKEIEKSRNKQECVLTETDVEVLLKNEALNNIEGYFKDDNIRLRLDELFNKGVQIDNVTFNMKTKIESSMSDSSKQVSYNNNQSTPSLHSASRYISPPDTPNSSGSSGSSGLSTPIEVNRIFLRNVPKTTLAPLAPLNKIPLPFNKGNSPFNNSYYNKYRSSQILDDLKKTADNFCVIKDKCSH